MMERAILMVNNEEKVSKLPVVGRIQNHPCMHAAVMDRPGGLACRILHLDEVEIPLGVDNIWFNLMEVLEAAWASKEIVCNTS